MTELKNKKFWVCRQCGGTFFVSSKPKVCNYKILSKIGHFANASYKPCGNMIFVRILTEDDL